LTVTLPTDYVATKKNLADAEKALAKVEALEKSLVN